MKNAALFLFLFFASLISAQEVTKDSTYFEQINGKYFSVRQIELENGSVTITKNIVGDGSADDLFNITIGNFEQKTLTLSRDAAIVSLFPKSLTEIVRQNALVKTLTLKSPLDTIQARNIAAYLLPGWTLKTAGIANPQDVTFTVTAGGQMRHSLGVTPRNVTFFGYAMRLHNFPAAGQTVDLFQLKNGNFVTLDRNYILRRPGSNQQSINKLVKKKN